MADSNRNPPSRAIREVAHPFTGESRNFDGFLDIVGDAHIVLLGEATHGTHEFYRARAEITKRLIQEKGFTAVAVEADWPDAYRVNRYVRGLDDVTAPDALAGFERFPQWMWRNVDVLAFVDWLRGYNDALPAGNGKIGHLSRGRSPAKVVVWEHNSHIGDARATEMGWNGELNVGQLVRERYGRDSVLAGFTTYEGTVTAVSEWGAPAELKRVRPALPGSYEELFHGAGLEGFLLNLRDEKTARLMPGTRLERAIGVIYLPETERISHYFEARLAEQFDAVLHYDRTQAVEPLERAAPREAEEPAETFPVGV